MTEPEEFYVTFGQKYRHMPHPRFPGAHPDGWYRLSVMDYGDAKKVAIMFFGADGFSMVWPSDEFCPELYPRGELGAWNIWAVVDDD